MSIMKESEYKVVKEQLKTEEKIKELLKELIVGNKDLSVTIIAKECGCSIQLVVDTIYPLIKGWKAKILNVENFIRGMKKGGCKECDDFYWGCGNCMVNIVEGKDFKTCKAIPICSCCGGMKNNECDGELWNRKKEVK